MAMSASGESLRPPCATGVRRATEGFPGSGMPSAIRRIADLADHRDRVGSMPGSAGVPQHWFPVID